MKQLKKKANPANFAPESTYEVTFKKQIRREYNEIENRQLLVEHDDWFTTVSFPADLWDYVELTSGDKLMVEVVSVNSRHSFRLQVEEC